MKVGKAIYNILINNSGVKSNFPVNDENYTPSLFEITRNGDFTTDSEWSGDYSISGGQLTKTAAGLAKQYNTDLSNGTLYEIKIDVESLDGATNFYLGGDSSPNLSLGSQTFEMECGTANLLIGINNGYDTATGSVINSISVKEMVLSKVFPELAPPGVEVPYIVYSVVSNSPSDTKNANGDIDTASIEVYGFQDTYNKAVDLGVSIRAALDRKTGTYNTIEIQSTNYVNEQMDVNEARKLWAAIQDYSIRIKNL